MQQLDMASEYCLGIADRAAEARLARQEARLLSLRNDIEGRLTQLESRIAEAKTWVESRRQLADAAKEELVEIFAGMEPDAAAEQLAGLEPAIAASIIRRLRSKTASAILNEMETKDAASLMRFISHAAALAPEAAKP